MIINIKYYRARSIFVILCAFFIFGNTGHGAAFHTDDLKENKNPNTIWKKKTKNKSRPEITTTKKSHLDEKQKFILDKDSIKTQISLLNHKYKKPQEFELVSQWKSHGFFGGVCRIMLVDAGAEKILLGEYGFLTSIRLTDKTGKVKEGYQSHHIIQDAAMKEEGIKNYDRNLAPSVLIQGPSTKLNTPHGLITRMQKDKRLDRGTLGKEWKIAENGIKALEEPFKLVFWQEANYTLRAYFIDEISLTMETKTRIPGSKIRKR